LNRFHRKASGSSFPVRRIQGSNTGLDQPCGLFIDSLNGQIFISNEGNNTITVFDSAASGNATPLRFLGRIFIIDSLTKMNNIINITESTTSGDLNFDVSIPEGIYYTGADLAASIQKELDARTNIGTRFSVVFEQDPGIFTLTIFSLGTVVNSLEFHWDVKPMTAVELGFAGVSSGPLVSGESDSSDSFLVNITKLNNPCGLFVDEINDDISVANKGNDTITFYKNSSIGNTNPNLFPPRPDT